MFLLLLASMGLATQPAIAQLGSSGGSSSPTGGRPGTTRVDFFELMQSGGEAFLGLFQQDAGRPTIDDPKWNSYSSPRETVLTFVEAMNHVASGRQEALSRAITALPASGHDEETAMKLLSVFDRLPELSPGSIPGSDVVQKEDIRRFELFPRGIDRNWAYKTLDSPPDGAIVLEKDGDQWLFSQSTIDGVGKLLDSMKAIPPRSRLPATGGLFKNVVTRTFTETTIGGWIFFIVITSIGFALAWLAIKGLRKLENSDVLDGDELLMPLIYGLIPPLCLMIITIAIAIGSARIELHPALSVYRWRIIEAAMVATGVWITVSLIELACLGTRRYFFSGDDPYAGMMTIVIRRVVRVIAAVILILFILQNVMKLNVTSLLGGFAIVGLALSLAAKDAMKNLFGAVTIFGNTPFIKGDWVKFEDYCGEIMDVGLQTTDIRLLSGEMLAVPNMQFVDKSVENLSERKYIRRTMNISITYDTTAEKVEQAIEILDEILRCDRVVGNNRGDLDNNPPHVVFDKFGSHFLNLRADYWYLMDPDGSDIQRSTDRGFLTYLGHCSTVNQLVLKRFNEAGIDFAFPTQTLHLENADA